MAQNGISTQTSVNPTATKILRREEKLALAAAKRSTTNTPGYRSLNAITGTHIAYVNGIGGATAATLSGTASPDNGRPWSTS